MQRTPRATAINPYDKATKCVSSPSTNYRDVVRLLSSVNLCLRSQAWRPGKVRKSKNALARLQSAPVEVPFVTVIFWKSSPGGTKCQSLQYTPFARFIRSSSIIYRRNVA